MPRHLLSWKTGFYHALLPALRRLGPARADAALGALGRLAGAIVPARRRELRRAADRVVTELPPTERAALRGRLAAGAARHLARDYLLEGSADADLDGRFDVTGFEAVRDRLDDGRGLLILGCHLGAHVAGLHWMVRRDLPVRLLVQRPRHVSPTLDRWFDRREPGDPHPQSAFFLRRGLPPAEAASRVLRARDALRAGKAVYLNGDIPWNPPAGRPGRLLGVDRTFLALWVDLAILVRVPVVPVVATHRPGGRYALAFGPVIAVCSETRDEALAAYLARLDAAVAEAPVDAIPYLTWPAYRASAEGSTRIRQNGMPRDVSSRRSLPI